MGKGRPTGAMNPHSLPSKLRTLKVGESLWLEEDVYKTSKVPGGRVESQVHQVHQRSTHELAGMQFSTQRADAITLKREHFHLVRITRTK